MVNGGVDGQLVDGGVDGQLVDGGVDCQLTQSPLITHSEFPYLNALSSHKVPQRDQE